MRFIGVLGVLALLGLAWAISYHRRDVRLRVIFWGLGLQFLFALIILREDEWSFIGMGAVAALVAVYLLRQDQATPERGYGSVALLLAAVVTVAVVLGLTGPAVAGVWFGLMALFGVFGIFQIYRLIVAFIRWVDAVLLKIFGN